MQPLFDKLAADGWTRQHLKGFLEHVGPLWCRKEGETIVEGLVIEVHHLNPRDTVHGGLLATLVDRGYGHTIRTSEPGLDFATIALNVQYLGAGRLGEFLTVRATIDRRTRDLIFLTARIDCNGKTIATSSAIFKAFA